MSADDVTTLPAVLETIVLAHRRMATHRPQGESVVRTSTSGLGRRNVLRRHHGRDAVRRGVAAGGVQLARERASGMWCIPSSASAAANQALSSRCWRRDSRRPDSSTELWIRVDVDPVPVDEAQEIVAELRSVLQDVRDVAVDQDDLVEVARSVAAELVDTHPSEMDETDVQDAARLIEWLVDGRFALLGHRLYDHGDEHLGRLGSRAAASRGGRPSRLRRGRPGPERGRRHPGAHPGQHAESGVPARAPLGPGRPDHRPDGTRGTGAPLSRRAHASRAERGRAGDPEDRTPGPGVGASGGSAPGVVHGAADARGDRRVPAGGTVLGRRGAAARSRRRGTGADPAAAAASVRRTRTLPTVLLLPGLPAT